MTTLRRGRSPEARPTLDLRRARSVALDLLARKPWTRRELTGRLRRRGAPADVADAVVAELESRGYVDDGAFATIWAESRARGRSLGRERLREELRARGVARPLVEAALARAFEDTDELTRAQAAAMRRVATLRRQDPVQVVRRLHDYLRRRGYPVHVVRQVLRAVCRDAAPEGAAEL
ncbi:MAG TPA: regulatory protein RecX [Methylomirabilota bacterium]|nr:regulatory protein RecX [Methylomirabilota bacterium]